MPSTGTPGSRKRTRRQNEAEPEHTPTTRDSIGPAIKKRRFNSNITSSPSTPKGFSAVVSAVGGALFKRQAGPKRSNKATSAYDVPDTDGEEGPDISQVKPTGSAIKRGKVVGNISNGQVASSTVYDVPDSGDELELTAPTSRSKKNNGSSVKRRASRTHAGIGTTDENVSTPRGKRSMRGEDLDGMIIDETDQEETPSKPRSIKTKKLPTSDGYDNTSTLR